MRPQPTTCPAATTPDATNPSPTTLGNAGAGAAFHLPPVLWADDLRAAVPDEHFWVWEGYLAAGNVTLLTSQWKSGKTTLVSVLLARLKEGGDLAGQRVAAGKAVVVSEEGPEHWLRRKGKLDFGRHVGWLCRPFLGRPTPGQWLALIDHLAGLHAAHGLRLVVIDPLAAFLPGGESDAGRMLDALAPLQRLTARGLAVLILHHPRKGETLSGQAARGSGALSGYVDVMIEMHCQEPGNATDRRRRLRSFSRHEATPRLRVIELNAEGTDYVACAATEPADADFGANWPALRQALEVARHPLTRRQILMDWLAEGRPPGDTTLWRWLDRAVAQQLVCRAGAGLKSDPFTYWLPGKMEEWERDPISRLYLQHLEDVRKDPERFAAMREERRAGDEDISGIGGVEDER